MLGPCPWVKVKPRPGGISGKRERPGRCGAHRPGRRL